MIFQGHIEKGSVVLDRPLPLPDGTLVRVEALSPTPADFWQAHALAELALRQGVLAPSQDEDLLGGWPTEELDDGFEEALLSWRKRELEQKR